MSSNRLAKSVVPDFALGGNATLTLKSGETGRRYTYKIVNSKDNEYLFFIHLLHGPDNENDYKYVGCYYKDTEYFHPAKCYLDIERRLRPPSIQAIDYFFKRLHNIPDNLIVYHEGKCARCGRKLTTPESLERGFGPECYSII